MHTAHQNNLMISKMNLVDRTSETIDNLSIKKNLFVQSVQKNNYCLFSISFKLPGYVE
jgi:hypothetical protein